MVLPFGVPKLAVPDERFEMKNFMKKILITAVVVWSASASAANLGSFNVDCRNGAVTNTALPATAKVGDTFTVTASSTADCILSISPSGAVSWTVTQGSAGSVWGGGTATMTILASGYSTFSATQTINKVPHGGNFTFTAAKGDQAINFPQPATPLTYANNLTFAASATSANTPNSGNAVSYTSTGACTVNSGTGVVSVTGAGTCSIIASQAGNNNWNAATPIKRDVTIVKANQAITFGAQAEQTYAPNGTFTINPAATASSNLPVTYAVSPNTVCTMGSGTTVNIIGAGTCAITASQAGNGNYNAATPVTQNVVIAKAAQTLTFPAQTPARRTLVDGGTFSINPVATSASPNSGSAIAYSSLTPLVCTVSGTTVSMLKTGTCTLAADQAGNGNYLDARQVKQDVVIVPPTTAIPTLNEWGLMLLGLLAAGLGARRLRRS